jgi:hypothetical protein
MEKILLVGFISLYNSFAPKSRASRKKSQKNLTEKADKSCAKKA